MIFFHFFSRFGFNLSFVQLAMNVDAVLPESVPCCTHIHTYMRSYVRTHTLSFTVMLSCCPSQIKFDILLVSVLCICAQSERHTRTHTDYIVYVCQDAYYTMNVTAPSVRYIHIRWWRRRCEPMPCRISFSIRFTRLRLRFTVYNTMRTIQLISRISMR